MSSTVTFDFPTLIYAVRDYIYKTTLADISGLLRNPKTGSYSL